ncbi:septum site-determining protein MinC [Ideonella sp. DXS29W]|uniref:Probable septum site-determining protein MinC n=1 Tax=Ideonella lacteola TaxID=2984193 RepID=A0ABU9BNL4_9BURK
MSVAPAGGDDAAFDLKNTSLPLLSIALKSADAAALADALASRLRETPQLFNHDPVVVDLSALREAEVAIDFEAVLAALRDHKLQPVAAAGGSPAQMEAALAAGLSEAPDPTPLPKPRPVEIREVEVVKEVVREVIVEVPAPVAPTLVVDRPLRSGQQVYARGGDLVVLAAVNFGAEVIADGHIHVYAPLRGKAIAGNKGNTEARIFSTCFEPELIAIAGVYRTTETALPAEVHGKPAQVRLVDDKLVMEPLKEPLKEPRGRAEIA